MKEIHPLFIGFFFGTFQEILLSDCNVFDNRQMIEQVERLENHSHFTAKSGYVGTGSRNGFSIDPNFTRRRIFKTVDATQ